MPLYRENPDKAFDVADMAWWAEMAPSIATSLTLMVPGVGVTKGLSAVGKLLNLSKNATKAANLLNMGQKLVMLLLLAVNFLLKVLLCVCLRIIKKLLVLRKTLKNML